MTAIHDLVRDALGLAPHFKGCSEEQALSYAVEQVLRGVLPPRALSLDEAQQLVDSITLDEEVDSPTVTRLDGRSRWAGVASREGHAIAVKARTDVLTVLHELAHVLAGDGHDEEWRQTFVGLVRRHVSVDHAGTLHALYARVGLGTTL